MNPTNPPRVAITRDEEGDGPLARAIERAGMVPVSCPAVACGPPADAEALVRASLDLDEKFHWLVVASPRAVAAMMEARVRPLPAELRTAAVGEVTAAALSAAGARQVLTAPSPGAAALVEALRAADEWPGRRVLLPRADIGRPELALGLRALGADVREVVAYTTVHRPAAEIALAWRDARPDAAVITSPSAAQALVTSIGAEALRRLRAVVAIGSTTQAALTSLGVRSEASEATDFDSVAERARTLLGLTRGDAASGPSGAMSRAGKDLR